MVSSEDTNLNSDTDKSISGNAISPETAEYPVNYPEQEGDIEAKVMPVTE